MRPSTRIALAMAAAAVGVVVFRIWFGGETAAAPTEERGASEGKSGVAAASASRPASTRSRACGSTFAARIGAPSGSSSR
jgi:hypothetical protein